ncbi:hypothetical protein LZL87_013212 [Fusarium oxysporum]|nr:hypothetical protein LZL87_013212 [Fusarium oxysporum]
MAIGADQGGSIKIPAALCGCVGFKPTHGLVPYTELMSGDAVIDHAGPINQTVLNIALAMDAINGYDGIDDRSLNSAPPGSFSFAQRIRGLEINNILLAGLKIGIISEGFDHAIVQPEVRTQVFSAAMRFKQLGASVNVVSIPQHLEGPATWMIQQRLVGMYNLTRRQHGRQG